MNSTLLVVSPGHSDLQISFQMEGKVERYEIAGDDMRAVHSWMRDNHVYVEGVDLLPPHSGTGQVGYDSLHSQLKLVRLGLPSIAIEKHAVSLHAAKLNALPSAVLASGLKIAGVLVLNTNRNSASEPFLNGVALANWLSQVFKLAVGSYPTPGTSCSLDYLDGEMRFEGTGGQTHNVKALERLDSAFKSLGTSFDSIILAVGGGAPSFREVIRSIARFRLPRARVLEYLPGKPNSLVAALSDGLHPVELFGLRRRAIDLLESGNSQLLEQLPNNFSKQILRLVGPVSYHRLQTSLMEGLLLAASLAS